MTTLDYQYAEWCVEWLAWIDQTDTPWYFVVQQCAMDSFWDGPEHDESGNSA